VLERKIKTIMDQLNSLEGQKESNEEMSQLETQLKELKKNSIYRYTGRTFISRQ
jgi:chromosome segregation ATPase